MKFFPKDEARVRLRFKVSIASETWSFNVGDVGELPAAQARQFIAQGHAELTESPVGDAIRPGCESCGGNLDNDSRCWSARCRGQYRAPIQGRTG